MCRFLILFFVSALVFSCNSYKGQLVGVSGNVQSEEFEDLGMVYIPSGSFEMGVADDKFNLADAPKKRVSLSPFYIDKTEITFKEYREFVYSVRDSLGLTEGYDKSKLIYTNPDTKEEINIYPNTTVWEDNFPESRISISEYFDEGNTVLDQYPVVGVNWKQALAFTVWRTKKMNTGVVFSLPTEAQWEYAAKGGIKNLKYPWIGSGTKNDAGFYLANFYPMPGNYVSDNGEIYIVPVAQFAKNGFGLYDMAGNVSEWVLDNYSPISYQSSNDHNPLYSDHSSGFKVVRGGSWKDISYFLQVGARDWQRKDSTYSYVGFRCVANYMGTAVNSNTPNPEKDIPLNLRLKNMKQKLRKGKDK
ncbi:MAG: SUMF1/EgtB/PvdO family nonheme iron enzyme [Bacteroidota bacterium]